MGNSGSGKDTITSALLERNKSFKKLIYATTRPIRPGEKDGETYYYVTDEEFTEMLNTKQMLETRSYTIANGNVVQYGTLRESFNDDILSYDSVYLVTCSLNQFKHYYSLAKGYMIPIVLEVPVEDRLERSIKRMDNPTDEQYAEIIRRIYDDSELLPTDIPESFTVDNIGSIDNTISIIESAIMRFTSKKVFYLHDNGERYNVNDLNDCTIFGPLLKVRENDMSESKRVCIIHHDDNDGIVAAACIYNYESTQHEYSADITLISANYTRPISDMVPIDSGYDTVYIVDYSIYFDADIEYLKLMQNTFDKVVWLDHHESSIKVVDANPTLKELDGTVMNGTSGALLAYIYTESQRLRYYDNVKYYDKVNEFFDKYSYSIANGANPANVVDIIVKDYDIHIPQVIIYVHLYDTWQINDDVLAFSKGYRPASPVDILKDVSSFYTSRISAENAIKSGYNVMNYITEENANDVNKIGFECSLEYKYSDGHKDTYSVLAMNTNRFTSLTFGDNVNKYDIVIPFAFDGESWRYSMYTNRDDIDVSVLCEACGGGGHKQASGFHVNKCFLRKDCVVTIDYRGLVVVC
jgi:guanylate kinase